jgi:hypothetical protein
MTWFGSTWKVLRIFINQLYLERFVLKHAAIYIIDRNMVKLHLPLTTNLYKNGRQWFK